jgi:hypothetical protein
MLSMEKSHFEVGLAPVADAFAGTVYSDVVNMKNHGRVRFIHFWGVGTTGTGTITVQACDDTVPSNRTAVPFRYRSLVAGAAPSAWAYVAATGFTTAAGSNQIYEIEVLAEDVGATGYGYVQTKQVEVAASARLGGILIEMLDAKFQGPTPITATT